MSVEAVKKDDGALTAQGGCWLLGGGVLQTGPESAGADSGPQRMGITDGCQ